MNGKFAAWLRVGYGRGWVKVADNSSSEGARAAGEEFIRRPGTALPADMRVTGGELPTA